MQICVYFLLLFILFYNFRRKMLASCFWGKWRSRPVVFSENLWAICTQERRPCICRSVESSRTKKFSASGGLRPPWLPTRGFAPGPRWGICPHAPVIGSRSTRSPWPRPLLALPTFKHFQRPWGDHRPCWNSCILVGLDTSAVQQLTTITLFT